MRLGILGCSPGMKILKDMVPVLKVSTSQYPPYLPYQHYLQILRQVSLEKAADAVNIVR